MKVRWRCRQCGRTAKILPELPVRCSCGVITTAPPSVLTRVRAYRDSTARWQAAGCPLRSEEEVEALRDVCAACEHYNGEVCVKCGCSVVRGSVFGDKLRRATESCPAGKW